MKKICFVFTLALSVLVSCTSKEDKADALVKDRGFDCPHIEKLEEFNCNPASSVLMMTAYNSLWQNDSLMRNMDLSSNNINYVYGKIANQEANAKGLLERADILSTSSSAKEELCGYYATISPTKINGSFVDKNRKCTKYEVFFDKDMKSIIGIHPIHK